jgi:hypothetical protein
MEKSVQEREGAEAQRTNHSAKKRPIQVFTLRDAGKTSLPYQNLGIQFQKIAPSSL